MRDRIRTLHDSLRTEQSYVNWIKRFIVHHGKCHPREMGADEVQAFLTHLAVGRHVLASTQNQALAALLFLYQQVLGVDLPWLKEVTRAKRSQRLPAVLSRAEVQQLLSALKRGSDTKLVVRLLYGTGMRILEALRLRVQDVDLARREIVIRAGKGNTECITVLPTALVLPLREQLQRRRRLFEHDTALGRAAVALPYALAEKYPNATR